MTQAVIRASSIRASVKQSFGELRMAPVRWRDIAELVGIAASLIFVGLQMKQTEDIARYEFYSNSQT